VAILAVMPTFFLISQLVPYLTDRGVSAAVGAQALGILAGSGVFGRLFMGWVAGRIGWMKSISIACFIGCLTTIWLLFITEPWIIYLCIGIYGFTMGSTTSLLSGTVAAFFGFIALAELLGFLLGMGVLVGAFIPWLSGLSFDLTGSYLSAVAGSAFLLVISAVVSLLLKPPSLD